MKKVLKKLELFPYTIPFIGDEKTRQGVLCKLFYEGGDIGYGDAAPLPSYSQETFSQAVRQLQKIAKTVEMEEKIIWDDLYPSVHFALQEPIFLSDAMPAQKFHGFLFGSRKQILEGSEKLRRENFDFVKIKISALSPSEIIALIKQLAPYFKLRLDANQKFSFEEAQKLFTPFKAFIDYVEEPTYEKRQIKSLSFPFALDETLRSHPDPEIFHNPHLKAVIIKPTLSGGRSRWDFLIPPSPIEVIIGTSWESSVGLSQLIKLHQEFNGAKRPAGLDTLRFLKEENPLLSTRGCYHFFSPRQEVVV